MQVESSAGDIGFGQNHRRGDFAGMVAAQQVSHGLDQTVSGRAASLALSRSQDAERCLAHKCSECKDKDDVRPVSALVF